jgi:peptide chain release factor 2
MGRPCRRSQVERLTPYAIIPIDTFGEYPCKKLSRTSLPCAPALTTSRCVFDVAGKQQQLAKLEAASAQPEFWSDSEAAQRTMRQIADLRAEMTPWLDLGTRIAEQADLLDLALAEGDDALAAEIAAGAPALRAELERLEFQLQLSGPYDRANAILAIHARAGGTEAQDWAQMLMRMYLRWGERRGYKTEVLDLSPGEEAGLKSVAIEFVGPYAYGYLQSERGEHRLVRISPFDAQKRRHTSFALVEVMPEVTDDVQLEINPEDVKFEAYRSGGPGGQNVNKVSTAVRLTHVPTGIVVTCQTERSQLQNRETALRMLKARLLEIEQERKEQERATLRGEHIESSWGAQIRSYVLHPYNLVKDVRTDYETSDTGGVLDGELDAFMAAYLAWQVGREPALSRE